MMVNGALPPSTPTLIFPIILLETGQRFMTGVFHYTKLLPSKKTSFKLLACFYLTKKIINHLLCAESIVLDIGTGNPKQNKM